MIKLEVCKRLFSADALKNAAVVPEPMKEGKWIIQMEARQDIWVTTTLENRRGSVREFSSIEAAIKTLGDIGFKKAAIHWE